MSNRRQVAVIVYSENAYHRKILRGIGAYMHDVGNWSLYIEDRRLHKLPDIDTWHGDGIIVAWESWFLTDVACQLKLPRIGIQGGRFGCDFGMRIPCFRTDNAAIGRLGGEADKRHSP